jgi:hypothetical protein
VTHAINLVVSVILTLAGLVMEVIGIADAFLAALMTSAGIPPDIQIIILTAVAVLLVIFAIRSLGGVFSVLIIILLVLLVLHRVVPGLQVPHLNLPANLQAPGSVHT